MKKLFAVLYVLIPVFYAAGMLACLYSMPEDEVLFTLLGGIIVLSFVSCIAYSILSANAKRQFLAITNIGSISCNLLLFAAEITWLVISYIQVRIAEQNGGMEGGLGIVLLIVIYMPHWISYLICRITASINCSRALKGISSSSASIIHSILHLFPITDLISAVLVLQRVNRFQHCQQPPIEME